MSDEAEMQKCEAELAAAIFSLENLDEAVHTWIGNMLAELKDKGKLACTAQVVIEPEGSKSQIGMMLAISFLPLVGGMPVVETLLPGKGGIVH